MTINYTYVVKSSWSICSHVLGVLTGVAAWLFISQFHFGRSWERSKLYWLLQWRRQALPDIWGWWSPSQDLGLPGRRISLDFPNVVIIYLCYCGKSWFSIVCMWVFHPFVAVCCRTKPAFKLWRATPKMSLASVSTQSCPSSLLDQRMVSRNPTHPHLCTHKMHLLPSH